VDDDFWVAVGELVEESGGVRGVFRDLLRKEVVFLLFHKSSLSKSTLPIEGILKEKSVFPSKFVIDKYSVK
jgi:hypothetical protein